jgi:hypothetical protein
VDLLAVTARGVRPDDWDLPLFLHILGAIVLVGGVVLALAYLAGAWRNRSAVSLRSGFRALLYGAIPGYIVMRGAAEWAFVKEHWDDVDPEPDWIGIGYAVADVGLLFLIIATIVSGVASRRALAAGDGEAAQAGNASVRTATILVSVLVVAYVIAIWAMTTKP